MFYCVNFFPAVSCRCCSLSPLHSIRLYWGAREKNFDTKTNTDRRHIKHTYNKHAHIQSFRCERAKKYTEFTGVFSLAPKFLSVDVRKPTHSSSQQHRLEKERKNPNRYTPHRELESVLRFLCTFSLSLAPIHQAYDTYVYRRVYFESVEKMLRTFLYTERRI